MSAAIVAPRMRWPLRAAAWLIAAALVVVAVRRIDFGALGSALRGTAWGWVVLATACAVVGNTLAQTRRWQALLEPIPHRQRASFFDLARVSLARPTGFSRWTYERTIGTLYRFAPNFSAVLPSPVTS